MKNFMKNLHPTIKFTFEHSTQEISSLDMKIHVGTDHKLSKTLYSKPTDCAVLLHFHSNHSLKWKESIVFSQALRYNLLIVDDIILQKTTRLPYSISLHQKIPLRNHYAQHLQSSPPRLWHLSLQNPQGIKFQNCPPSCDPVLIGWKTILQVSTTPLTYHWKWSTTALHLAKPTWFEPQTVDILNHVSAFSCQENWIYQTTWPH